MFCFNLDTKDSFGLSEVIDMFMQLRVFFWKCKVKNQMDLISGNIICWRFIVLSYLNQDHLNKHFL